MEAPTYLFESISNNKTTLVVTHQQRVICGIIYLAITVAGIFGNAVVIFAVFASKKLQTFTNMFVVNLSVADLLACLMMQLQCIMMLTPDEEAYPLSETLCAMVGVSLCVACGCSIYTLASIGFYRQLLLTDKSRKRADKLQTTVVAVPWIALTWIIPTMVNLIPHAVAMERFGYNEKYRVCGAQSESGANHEIELAQVFGLYTPALFIITLSYGYIYWYVNDHTANTLREMDSESQSSGRISRWRTMTITSWTPSKRSRTRTTSTMSNSSHTENARQLYRRQITITKNMFYVVLAFVICMTPYSVCLVWPHLDGLLYSGTLLMFNSCINPVLYGLKHPHFRQVFKALLTCQWSRVPKPSNAFKTLRNLRKGQKYEERIHTL